MRNRVTILILTSLIEKSICINFCSIRTCQPILIARLHSEHPHFSILSPLHLSNSQFFHFKSHSQLQNQIQKSIFKILPKNISHPSFRFSKSKSKFLSWNLNLWSSTNVFPISKITLNNSMTNHTIITNSNQIFNVSFAIITNRWNTFFEIWTKLT